MSKNTEGAVQLRTDNGGLTPLSASPIMVDRAEAALIKAEIVSANDAKPGDFVDITPEYWEAKAGSARMLKFLGWKRIIKEDETTGLQTEKYMATFHDGDRPVVMGQLAIMEAMLGGVVGAIYRVTCTESAAGKAKKFKVEQLNIGQ